MTVFAILIAGIALSSAIIHFAIGLGRPRDIQHTIFAVMMAVTCVFQLIVARLYVATKSGEIEALTRVGVVAAIGIIVLFAIFVSKYAGLTIRRSVAWAYLGVSALWLVYDLVTPHGLLLQPRIESANRFVPSLSISIGIGWQLFNSLTVAWGVIVGLRMVRRGDPQSGAVLAVGSTMALSAVVLDLVRNLLGRNWLYFGGIGLIGLAILLSTQLALNYKARQRYHAELGVFAMHFRDQVNTPLQTLQFGLQILDERSQHSSENGVTIRLQRALAKVIALTQRLGPGARH